MSDKRQYVYHPGTGTLIAAAECQIVELDDVTADLVAEGGETPRGQKIDNPFAVISFTGAAIREHYENWDQTEKIENLTDTDLDEVGEWAMNAGFVWDAIYSGWDYGLEQVKAEREAGLDGPL